jgi:hypothetical protein
MGDLARSTERQAHRQLTKHSERQGKESLMRGLDSLNFDATNLTLQGDQDNARTWTTPTGDVVALYALGKQTEYRAVAADLDAIRARARQQASQYGGAIVEVELCDIGGVSAVREIVKIPQKPTGMGYMGSFALPMSECAYLISAACRERGITGVRDTAILAKLIQSGEIKFEDGAAGPVGWMQDPYDPSILGPPARNRADEEAYDSLFPEHPLSRVRGLLRQIGGSVQIADELKGH